MKFKPLLSSYYLLTSFLHIGYLEKCITARMCPRSSFGPLPAITGVWNWALRPRHSGWGPKIRQINFTNVTLKSNPGYGNFEPSSLLCLQSPGQGLEVPSRAPQNFSWGEDGGLYGLILWATIGSVWPVLSLALKWGIKKKDTESEVAGILRDFCLQNAMEPSN